MEVIILSKTKRNVLWLVVIILIVGSWTGNVWYYDRSQLEEPLFLRHHITMFGNVHDHIELQYLENKNEGIQVSWIQIDELPQLRFQLFERSSYTHQVRKIAAADWSPEELNLEENTPLTIHEIIVHYNNGESKRVPIGEINVLWRQPVNHDPLEVASSGGSSDGTGFTAVRATQPLTVEDIDYTFRDKMPSFELKLANTSLDELTYPIQLAERHGLNLNYRWRDFRDNPYRYDVFRSHIVLRLRDQNQREVITYLPINQNLSFSEHDIRRLVQSGGDY